jgi:exopolyphosphatase/pppGpp-phosphohydrolase
MAKTTTQKLHNDITKPPRKKSTPNKIDPAKLIKTAQENPNLTTRQLGTLMDTTHSAIVHAFKRYGLDRERIESFKVNRADIMAGLQETVAASFTEEDIKKASVRDRTILFGTLYDKERLERGQSTQNVATILASSVVEATASRMTQASDVTLVVTPDVAEEITPDKTST